MSKFKIVISPYARKTDNPNPKDYPYWNLLIKKLNQRYENLHFTQIGLEGEKILEGVNGVVQGMPLMFLKKELQESDLVLSVDNAIQHLCARYEIPCVCIFSVSNPKIWGHQNNRNIYKDKKYFAEDQFLIWDLQDYNKDAFIEPEKIDIDFYYGQWLSRKD